MTVYKIKITPLAEQDIEQAGDYIAFQLSNPTAALNTVQRIRQTIRNLQFMPQRHQLYEDPDLSEYNLRVTYFKNYRIFYLVNENEVQIIRVLHMLTNSPDWLYQTLNKPN